MFPIEYKMTYAVDPAVSADFVHQVARDKVTALFGGCTLTENKPSSYTREDGSVDVEPSFTLTTVHVADSEYDRAASLGGMRHVASVLARIANQESVLVTSQQLDTADFITAK